MSPHLNISISDGLWQALQERASTSGQPVDHIVQAALADALDMEHDALYQVSTAGALLQGVYQGFVSIAELRRHGDLGLGTFDSLDGELIVLDGICYRARADGSVVVAEDDELTPFASIVHFAPDFTASIDGVTSIADLTEQLDSLRTSANETVSFRLDARFPSIEVRAACKSQPGVDLVTATSSQALFNWTDVEGTLVGFWSPQYFSAITIPGYHLHFISADRTKGGHLLDLVTERISVQINEISDVHLAIPENAAFLEADLTGDTTQALKAAESKPPSRP